MRNRRLLGIDVGYQVFTPNRLEEVGAVRQVSPGGRPEIVVYIENAGDFVVPATAVARVVEEKVILDVTKVDPGLLAAIEHAHDAEVPGV